MDDGAAGRPGVLARLRAATAGGPLGNRSASTAPVITGEGPFVALLRSASSSFIGLPSSFRSSAKTQGTAAM